MLQSWGPNFDSLRATKISRHAKAGDATVAFSRTSVILGNNLALHKSLTHSYSSKNLVSVDVPFVNLKLKTIFGGVMISHLPQISSDFWESKSIH